MHNNRALKQKQLNGVEAMINYIIYTCDFPAVMYLLHGVSQSILHTNSKQVFEYRDVFTQEKITK